LLISSDQTATVAVGLGMVAGDACENLPDLIDERGAHFEIGSLPTVAGNRVLLTEVFQNLIANAIKYTSADRSPRITISACRVESHWYPAVSDEGIGIAPEYHQRMFNIFERPGGKIWVESEVGHHLRLKTFAVGHVYLSDVAAIRTISSAIFSGDRTKSMQPLAIALAGMSGCEAVSSLWAMVMPPTFLIPHKAAAPSPS